MNFLIINLIVTLALSSLLEPLAAIDMLNHIDDHHSDNQTSHHHDGLGAVDHHHSDESDDKPDGPLTSEESHSHTISASILALSPMNNNQRMNQYLHLIVGSTNSTLELFEGFPFDMLRPPINI